MSVVFLFLVTGVLSWPVRSATGEYPIGDVRNCPTTSPFNPEQPLYPMEVLPDTGYDALRDIDMGQVFNHNYSLCRVSKDGNYLLPDDFYLSPIRESQIEEYAEIFDHWNKYSSLTSKTISAHASVGWGFAKISSSFSSEHTTVKSHMVNDKSSVVRIHLRNKICSVHVQSRSPLHPDFKSRLFEIAAYLDKNITDHAHYLAELLIRDYGTHYLKSVEAGAIISQTDFINNTYFDQMQKDTRSIKVSASASFFGKISIGGGFSTTTQHTQDSGYSSSQTKSIVQTIGGPAYSTNMTIDKWQEGIANALVAIDRSGEPLHFVINSNTMPELRHESRAAVADIVYKAINRYFKVNTHAGCTNPKSQNFDFQANVDDSKCESEHIPLNYTFGGAYQRCTAGDDHVCNLISQTNPLTNDYTCPDDNYIPVKMFSGKISITHRFLFIHWTKSYYYDAYWCVAKPKAAIPVGSFFLFGGYYTSSTPNPLTNTMGCPQYFIPLKVGNYISVCVSTDYEIALQYAVPFGGFETCQSGNPLAMETFNSDPNTWPHQCPHGYTSYFGGVEHGCDINICIKSNAFNSGTYNELLPPKLPPFHHHPSNPLNDSDLLSFVGSDGNVWSRNMFGKWSHEEPASQCYEDVTTSQQEMHTIQTGTPVYTTADQHSTTDTETTTHTPENVPLQNNNGLPVVAITLPTVIFGVLIVCIIALVIIVLVRRFHKHRHGYDNMRHCHVNDQPSNLNTPA